MDTINATTFPHDVFVWEDLRGQPRLTVLLKASFSFKGGQVTPLDPPVPIFESDVPFDDEKRRTVRFEGDRVPYKPKADVVLVGMASAPRGKAVPHFDATLTVGRVAKTVRVFGDRRWEFPSPLAIVPRISGPSPITRVELGYELAYGGVDAGGASCFDQNPEGCGHVGRQTPKSLHHQPLPNLEDPDDPIKSWKSRPAPSSFGFYGRGWEPRRTLAGTWDEVWVEQRAPLWPEDFTYAFYNGAHPDLQVKGYLRGDEAVRLENFDGAPSAAFTLPGFRPRIRIERWREDPLTWADEHGEPATPETVGLRPPESQKAALDTLVLVPEDRQFYEVFRAVFDLEALSIAEVARIHIEPESVAGAA